MLFLGWEPWSSGYGRRLVFQRLQLRIPALDVGLPFFISISCKNGTFCLKLLRKLPTTLVYWYTVPSVTRLVDLLDFVQLLKPLATINLPKSPTFLGNFCKGFKIYHFSSEIVFGQLLQTFGNFYLVTLVPNHGGSLEGASLARPDKRFLSTFDNS